MEADAVQRFAVVGRERNIVVTGIEIFDVLKNNDAYNALAKTGGLIITGPTGTNVNDVAVALLNG